MMTSGARYSGVPQSVHVLRKSCDRKTSKKDRWSKETELPIINDLGEAKIAEFDVTFAGKQDVLGLEVPEGDAERVQVLQRQDNLTGRE